MHKSGDALICGKTENVERVVTEEQISRLG